MLHEMGIDTGIDLPALIAASRAAQEVLGRRLGSHVLTAGPVDWKDSAPALHGGGDERRARRDRIRCARRWRAPGRAAPSATTPRPPSRASCPCASASGACSTPGSFREEALLAGWEQDGEGAEGVVTGLGDVGGRPVAVMANDPTVKAGSWAPKTVEKILRIQERALALQIPMVYLVDSAGARINEQVQMFPGRRGAGRIFFNQVRMSGVVPQICVLFGPSAAGGAYIPAFCDIVIMRDGNASMYLGSPRMAEMVIGEKVTLEEMGGAKMHTGGQRLRARARALRRGGRRPRPALPRLLPRPRSSRRRRS